MSSLYGQANRANRMGAERQVQVREINMDRMFIIGETPLGDKIRINFTLQDPLVAVPSSGEVWSITQMENEWHLNRRLEIGNEITGVRTLEPGDRRLEATHKVYINGEDVIVNGVSFNDLLARVEALEGP